MAKTATVAKKPATKPAAKPVKKPAGKKQQTVWATGMPFEKINYILMVGGMVVLLIGYFLLSGGGTDDPTKFSESIFDTRRLYIAPIVLVFGFLLELFAIMYRPRTKESEQNISENKN